jgi:hypothetical protein
MTTRFPAGRIITALAAGVVVFSMSAVDGYAAKRDHRSGPYSDRDTSNNTSQGGVTLGKTYGGRHGHEAPGVRPAPIRWHSIGPVRDHR